MDAEPAPSPAPDESECAAALAEKVAFLRRPEAYSPHPESVEVVETHMSWVFIAGDEVWKLKKPVFFPFLDFRSLESREADCRRELSLNRRLAPDIYLDVTPLVRAPDGHLVLGGAGEVVDWLVKMRRLPAEHALHNRIAADRVSETDVDAIAECLGAFYRTAKPVPTTADAHIARWRDAVLENLALLDNPAAERLETADRFRVIVAAQRRFLDRRRDALAERAARRRIVDGHGDLRPEHVFLNRLPHVIDCLSFDPRLRALDVFHDLAFLAMECDRLGARWIGERLIERCQSQLSDHPPEDLIAFYKSYRACVRARLALAHLDDSAPREPEKWPPLADAYVREAARYEDMVY